MELYITQINKFKIDINFETIFNTIIKEKNININDRKNAQWNISSEFSDNAISYIKRFNNIDVNIVITPDDIMNVINANREMKFENITSTCDINTIADEFDKFVEKKITENAISTFKKK